MDNAVTLANTHGMAAAYLAGLVESLTLGRTHGIIQAGIGPLVWQPTPYIRISTIAPELRKLAVDADLRISVIAPELRINVIEGE